MDTRPYYTRRKPIPQDPNSFAFDRIDLSQHHLPPYPQGDARLLANSLFDSRAAAAVRAAVGNPASVTVKPTKGDLDFNALLECKRYGDKAATIFIPTPKCLAAMAYEDYFPGTPDGARLRTMVSDAIMAASPGWCGSSGPGVSNLGISDYEGNYDMTEMFLLPLAYGYYDVLSAEAREKLITSLLAQGRIARAALDDTVTSGGAPNDWSRAGRVTLAVIGVSDIPETENHVLMIATARYLTNQLMYQRHQGDNVTLWYDNRRNGSADEGRPTCLDQILLLLRNKLRNDFAEYNAKSYQEESRWALLNLYSYAYDAEVRLAAGMVLDYVSAHIAVSSCDLRRLVPFRRRDEPKNVNQDKGVTDVDLLDGAHGADPMAVHFALHAGNTRAFAGPDNRVWPGDAGAVRPWEWALSRPAAEPFHEAACDHRLAPSVHDLFVNDLHRRFYQRLHRRPLVEPGNQRNTDNLEIYSGSPSYLISAGGRPAIWVIPGKMGYGYQQQNLGVAVPISFMPAGALADASVSDSRELIQIMHLSDVPVPENGIQAADHGATENYGVAPDFACGVDIHLPAWTGLQSAGDGLHFSITPSLGNFGFYLAIHKWGRFAVLEAFDTWRHPEVSYAAFQARVAANNPDAAPASGVEAVYTTYFGNRIRYVIWQNLELDNHVVGSKILKIEYAGGDPADTLANAGNDSEPFLNGNIMTSPQDGVVEIRNPFLGTTLKLDWHDEHQLVRTSETGEVQQAGANLEVWVDFDWHGAMEGDFHRPFNTLAAAVNAVANGGVIRIMPGAKRERFTIHKRVRLHAVRETATV